MSLADQIRAAREQWVTVGGHEFRIRRPTAYQVATDIKTPIDKLRHCVVGWKLKELDLIGSAGGGAVPAFDIEALIEWAQDRVDVFVGLVEAIDKTVADHFKHREAAEGN